MRRCRNVSSKQTDKTKDRRCDHLRDLREHKLEETTRKAWTDRGQLSSSKDTSYLHNLSEYREVPKHRRSSRLSSSNSDCSTSFSSSCSGDGIDSTSELNDKSATIFNGTSTVNGKIKVFDCIDNALEQLKPVDDRCKCAVVCLTNLQVTTEKYFTFNIEHCSNIGDLGMKPKSKSPKLQTDSKLLRQKDSPVLTTYIKSDTMDLLDDKRAKSGDNINSKGKIVAADSQKLTKKLNQGKNETPKIPKIRHHGEGDSKTFNTEHTSSALLKIDISMTETSSDTEAMPLLKEVNSVAKIQKPKSLDGSKSPIRRGRKPKSGTSTPSTPTDSNTGLKMIPDISVTPSKDSETVKKVAKGRKKLEKPDPAATDLVDGLDENKLSVKHISRNPSESPSPEKSKIDGPSKDLSPVKPQSRNSSISPQPLKSKSRNSSESPSPRRMQKTPPSKTSPKSKITLDLIPKFDGEEEESSLNIRTSVDDAIDAVTNRVKEDLKNSPSKTPRKPRKSESPDKRVVKSPNGERKVSVDKKSPNSQGNDSCSSSGKKKPCSRSPSSSPKKGKLKSGVRDAVRELEFDSEITRVILEKSKLPFPSDFQYKYTSNISETRPLALSELIDKVKVKAVIDPADELTALFGKLPEPDYESEKSLSPSSSDLVNVSTDSDKTVTEFDTLTGSIKEETGDTISNSLESDDKKENESGVTDKDDILSNITDKQSNHNDNSQITEDEEDKQILIEESKSSVERKPLTLKSNTEEATSAGDNLDTSPVKTVSVFEMFGLKLKTKANEELKTNMTDVKNSQKYSKTSEQDTENKIEAEVKMETEDEDVMFVSETKVEDSVVISSDDESIENSGDKAGASSGKKRGEKRVKPKFTTVNNIVEPKPLEVLSRLEKANARKESAFVCKELDKLLVSHKDNVGATPTSSEKDAGASKESPKALIKEELKRADPDFDEIDGHVFISFASEIAMKAHVSIEKKADWLTEAQFRKMAHLKQMKERQQDQGSKRVTDIKSTEEQKLNFRGIPMRMLKYQKILKQELEDILMGRQRKSAEKSALKTPQKTADITKIKGWKEKFQNAEELQEATGINISESGKVHWKTEERLVKNLDPEDLKDIGLDLKKKRRKLVNYSNKKRKDQDGENMNYEYDIDDLAITESDVYNEDDEKPVMEKIPYHVKYLSQHKYGARKLFVKKMKLDAEDERILQKLGTQKMRESRSEDKLPKKEKELLVLSKITHSMAVAAVSALDKKLLNKAKSLEKAADKKKNKKGGRAEKIEEKPEEAEPEEVEEEMLGEQDADTVKGVDEDVNDPDYVDENAVKEDKTEDKTAIEPNENKTRTRRLSSVTKSRRKSGHAEEGTEVKVKQEVTENTCTEPGCRYGCICYLCKLSDSSEEKEADFKPPCDKEYCRLGCICDSIETKTTDGHHCRKPGCMFECKCPPKQPKPDIPREKGRKKKGKGSKKKRRLSDKPSEETVAEEAVTDGDDNAWEPPSKKKKGTSGGRFANLPKRETTYRVAKNLDAVSRKAMEVYVSSEMFTEQKVRRRRSDQNYEDFLSVSDLKDLQENKASKSDGNSEPPDGKDAGVLEISDEDTGSEPSTDDALSCARICPYSGPYKQKREIMMLNKRKGGPGSRNTVKNVIDLVDSDKEDNSGKPEDKSSKSDVPSTSREPQSVTEKMGLTNKIAAESKDTDKDESKEPKTSSKWKTQMVCLKAKKKPSDEKSQQETAATSAAATAAGEIKLLEIMSNCNWEIDRTNMLSKISHIISKESLGEGTSSQFISWGAYLLEFLPKADKPAVIPPELKCKLPNEMFSIRIKVTKDVSKDGKSDLELVAEPSTAQETEGAQGSSAEMSDEDRKKNNLKLQKKLIDKIKFAERLRNLIIQEQQKGVTPSKFSVSREGIEKALKKYKTQLWKAYTGSSNFTLQQLKKALQAAKGGGDVSSTGSVPSTSAVSAPISLSSAIPITSCDMMSAGTLTRLQNQGLTVLQPNHVSSGHSFINLSNLQSGSTAVTAASPLGNIMVHSSLSSSSHCPVSGSSFVPLGTIGSGKAFNQVGVENTSTPLVNSANQSLKNAIDSASVSVPVTISADCFPHIPAENFPAPEKTKIITLQRVSPPLSNSQSLKLNAVKVNNQFNLVPVSSTESVPLKSSANDQTASSVSILSAPASSMISATSPVTQDIIVNSTVPIGSTTSTTTTVNSAVVTIPNVMTMGKNLAIPPGKIIFVNTNPSAGKSLINPPQYLGSVTLSSNAKGAQSNPSSPQPIQFPHPLKNIANINTTSMGTIITPTGPRRVISHPNGTSTGIYPIRFENGAVNSGMHVAVPSPEMIGFPKVSSLPFTLVPAGTSVDNNNQKMVLVPITAPLPGGFVSVANSVTGRLPDAAGRTVPSPVFGVPQQGISAAPVVEIRTPINAVSGPPVTSVPTCKEIKMAPIRAFVDQTKEVSGFNNTFAEFVKLSNKFEVIHSSALTVNKTKPNADCGSLINGVSKTTNSNASTKVSEVTTDAEKNSNSKNHDSAIVNMENSHTEKRKIVDKRNHSPIKVVEGEISPENKNMDANKAECVHISDSDDNGDLDSLASSTRSLSSLSETIKTDVQKLELNCDTKVENGLEKKREVYRNFEEENEEIKGILGIGKSAGNEMANTPETVKGKHNEEKCFMEKITENAKKTSESIEKKIQDEITILDDTDDSCLIIDEENDTNSLPAKKSTSLQIMDFKARKQIGKRKQTSPDMLDEIVEWSVKKLKSDDRSKVKSVSPVQRAPDAIQIEDSEDSDVDILSCEFPEGSQSSKSRKKDKKTTANNDDLLVMKVNIGEFQSQPSTRTSPQIQSKNKHVREKFRRLELKNLFDYLEKVVFKYNTDMQNFPGVIPKHMILEEAKNLLKALKQKNDLLKECLDDGLQYQKSLQYKLKALTSSFLKAGVPKLVLKNFLVGVEKSLSLATPKRKKTEADKVTDEDSDSTLDFDPMTPAFVKSRLYPVTPDPTDPIFDSKAQVEFLVQGFETPNPRGDSHQPNVQEPNRTAGDRVLEDGTIQIEQDTGDLQLIDKSSDNKIPATKKLKPILPKSLLKQQNPRIYKLNVIKPGNKNEKLKVQLVQSCSNEKVENTKDVLLSQSVNSPADCADVVVHLGKETAGDRSSSDEDEVRSSTGDTLLDPDHDLMHFEHIADINQSGDVIHHAGEIINQSEPVS